MASSAAPAGHDADSAQRGGPDAPSGQQGHDADSAQRGGPDAPSGQQGHDADSAQRGGPDAHSGQQGHDADSAQRGGPDAPSGQQGHDAPSGQQGHDAQSGQRALSVLLYSDDSDVRAEVRLAVGRRPAPDLPQVRWTEVATEAAVLAAVDAGGLDVLVLDGEAVPAGGMGVCKQLKDEIYRCPPVLVLIGRPADAWLATWSRADLVVPHPLDPVAVAEAVAELARRRLAQ